MASFLKRIVFFSLLFLLLLEIVSRIVLDPLYYASIDSYNIHSGFGLANYNTKKTDHVDYLFIGSSRVPATIDPEVFMQKDKGKVAVVAGRGYMTAGIHYQALKNRVAEFPNYLKGAKVFIEYPGSKIYDEPFSKEQYLVFEKDSISHVSKSYLLLPHINFHSLKEFMMKSDNSFGAKMDLCFLYFSSAYRTIPFIKERMLRLDKPLFSHSKDVLASEGGIRNDFIEQAIQKAVTDAKITSDLLEKSPLLTDDRLNNSSLAYLNNLITEHGGKLYLYKIPLHSIQEKIYSTKKEKQNQQIFEDWLKMKDIPVVYPHNFKYKDSDFPDTWHLGINRRSEFSKSLFESIKDITR